MHAASFLGASFSVVTTLGRTRGIAAELAERYGMQRFCVGTSTTLYTSSFNGISFPGTVVSGMKVSYNSSTRTAHHDESRR